MSKETPSRIEIENILHDLDAPQSAIDNIMNIFMDSEKKAQHMLDQRNSDADTVDQIKLRMMDEPDWRKRAAMSARIISKSLDQ